MADDFQSPLTPEQKARAKFLDDFTKLMGDAQFRRWLWHLVEDPGWCASFGYGAETKNVNAMYFALGKREIGMLLNMTAKGVADESYRKMILEATNVKTQRELRHAETNSE